MFRGPLSARFCALLLAALICAAPVLAQGLAETTPTGNTNSLFDLYLKGGPVMHLISICSIFSLVLAIWLSIVLRPSSIVPEDLVRQVWNLLSEGKAADARALCERMEGVVPRLFLAGLKRANAPAAQVQRALESAGEREAARLNRNVRYLSEIASLTPMLGLLGTVLGLINAFQYMGEDPAVRQPALLAVGVYEALVSTAWGLIVAVPSMALFFYFRAKVQHILMLVEQLAEELMDQLVALPSRWEGRGS